jgi:hypothetical protein
VNERIEQFLENFGKAPEVAPPPLIPQRWRIPAFVTMVCVGIVVLCLFVWLVVMPAIRAQSPASPPSATTNAPGTKPAASSQ